MSNESGVLYVVATPIGNLEDISMRAQRILGEVDLIAAEDTRHSRKLLAHLGISTPMQAYHDHNERTAAPGLIEQLQRGRNIALISDAGTPLLQDPGYQLVKLAHEQGIRVVPVPGASALLSALSVAGLSAERFIFEGFLAEKQVARKQRLEALATESRTLVFYEAPHRIQAFIQDCLEVFGYDRQACIAREISKYHETVHTNRLGALAEWLAREEQQRKGEFVIVIQGAEKTTETSADEARRIVKILLQSMTVKQAAAAAAEITGKKKNELYTLALGLKSRDN